MSTTPVTRIIVSNARGGLTTDTVTPLVNQANAAAAAAQAAALTAQSSGYPTYNTKAAATSALSSIAANAYVNVLADESQNGSHTIYQKISGSLVLAANASAISQPTTITYQPATPSAHGGNSQLLYRRPSPMADGWGDLSFSISASEVTDTISTYADNAWCMGWNATTSFGRRDNAKPAGMLRFEEYYRGANAAYVPAAEFHLAVLPTGASTELRYFSGYLPHSASDWKWSAWSFQFARMNWYTAAGADVVEQWTPKNGTDLSAGYSKAIIKPSVTLYQINNYAHSGQLNVAGDGTIALPYINNLNQLAITGPAYLSGPLSANVFGNKAIETVLYDGIDTATGTVNLREVRGSAAAPSGLLVQAEAFYQDAVAGLRKYFYNGAGDCWHTFVANGHTFSVGTVSVRNSMVIAKGDDLSNVLAEFPAAGGIYIADSTSAPTTPSAGAILYSLSGSLHAAGSGGTVTPLANA